ncbi:MAG: ABC transporter ATP-binding protein [Acidimicrobiia bacterium]|nr:ABC transporter ATP-binding protein [Acidimicrobiia bacterium]
MTVAIHTEGLTKFYGKERGIVDLDLDVYEGEVFGYLGPNGAGKTTTIRLLLDLLRPTRGTSRVLGKHPYFDGVGVRSDIGYLPGELALYGNLSGEQLLTYISHLRKMDGLGDAPRLAEQLELDLSRPVGDLSSGNKQKVGLVQAFMDRPKVLILDEPTGGLDPLMQQEFYRLVHEAKGEGRTVFLSSHVLSEVERMADRVGIIRQGKMVVVEQLETLKERAPRRLELHFAAPVSGSDFEALDNVEDIAVDGSVMSCRVVGSLDELIKVAARFEVTNVVSHEADLEELFLQYYRGAEDVS